MLDAPPLDPKRRMHLRAYIALIEHECAESKDFFGHRGAQKILNDLVEAGIAELSPGPAGDEFSLGGVAVQANCAARGLLNNWIGHAKDVLAGRALPGRGV